MAKKKKAQQNFDMLWASIGILTGTSVGLSLRNPFAVVGLSAVLGYAFGKYLGD